jgi:hypothetical protein
MFFPFSLETLIKRRLSDSRFFNVSTTDLNNSPFIKKSLLASLIGNPDKKLAGSFYPVEFIAPNFDFFGFPARIGNDIPLPAHCPVIDSLCLHKLSHIVPPIDSKKAANPQFPAPHSACVLIS